MGCPVVTLAGDTFTSRVTASMLNAAGLSELIAAAPRQYETLIIELARDLELREALRVKLEHARETAPLFDTPRYVRNLERAYSQMAANAAVGGPPSGFDLR